MRPCPSLNVLARCRYVERGALQNADAYIGLSSGDNDGSLSDLNNYLPSIVARRRNTLVLLSSPPQRAIVLSFSAFADGLCFSFLYPVASGGPLSLSSKERGKRNRQREPISRRFPLDSLPDGQGGRGPHWIPQGLTKDESWQFSGKLCIN